MQVVQQTNSSPDQAYPDPRCAYVAELSPDHRPTASPEQSGEGLRRQPTCLKQRKYSQSVKYQEGRRTQHTPPLCPLRITSLKTRFPPEHSPYLYFRPISLQFGVEPEPRTEPQTFAFVKIDLGSCCLLVRANRLLHSLYIQVAGYKDCDIIGERGNPYRKRASKRDTAQGRIRPLIPKSTEHGAPKKGHGQEETSAPFTCATA